MANGVNKVILVGNLGRDPEVQNFDNGVKKASFSLATTEGFKNKEGGRTEHTEWHNIVLWRGLAEVAESFLKKGNSVYIEGKIRTRDWTDKDGNKRYTTEIVGDNMVMLGSKRDQQGGENGSYQKPEKASQPEPHEQNTDLTADTGGDDLPF